MKINEPTGLDPIIEEGCRALGRLFIEVVHFLMAHPTHLTLVLCVVFVSSALVKIMAHARMTAVELKTIEERREAQEIEADRDVQVEASRARTRVAAAQLRIADAATKVPPVGEADEVEGEVWLREGARSEMEVRRKGR